MFYGETPICVLCDRKSPDDREEMRKSHAETPPQMQGMPQRGAFAAARSGMIATVVKVLHIPRERLERYVLDQIAEGPALADIEEHLLWCEHCLDYVADLARLIESLRAGNRLGGFDVEVLAEEFKTWRQRLNDNE